VTDTGRVQAPEVTESISHRCPRMAEHQRGMKFALPIPCPECYSLHVVATRIPYEPDMRWRPVTAPARVHSVDRG
jgi:hypothetical protein